MGVRLRDREVLDRLSCKSLEAESLAEIQQGLGCSPFESQAIQRVVEDIYFPYMHGSAGKLPPGKLTLVAVDAEEPAGKPVAECRKVTVCLTVHRGRDDDELVARHGPAALRRALIPELCQEALSQGGLLSCEDLAYRVFFVTPRTITRDLKALRESGNQQVIPLRGTVHDIGPALTHRTEVVRLALEGKTTTEICRILRHSPKAVGNYLSVFTRCVQLHQRGMRVNQIGFLLRRGYRLVEAYIELFKQCENNENMRYHLDELMRLGLGFGEKNPHTEGGVQSHG